MDAWCLVLVAWCLVLVVMAAAVVAVVVVVCGCGVDCYGGLWVQVMIDNYYFLFSYNYFDRQGAPDGGWWWVGVWWLSGGWVVAGCGLGGGGVATRSRMTFECMPCIE